MTTFADAALGRRRPDGVTSEVTLPRKLAYLPSPPSWRDQIVYFLLVDRFSDGQEADRPLLDRSNLAAQRLASPNGEPWRWDRWAQSGGGRFQGGTLAGVRSKLGYLRRLGITAVWLSPVFKQRGHVDSYHGYGVQDFVDVDPRFGTREDLVTLVDEAHEQGLRVILDVIFNHSGSNWSYQGGVDKTPYRTDRYPFGAWRGDVGQDVVAIGGPDDGVWPAELQDPERYTRAGTGNLGAGDIVDSNAEHKRSDFENLRDFALDAPGLLSDLARCYKYWIALTGCDGFRVDTLKHVTFEEARSFCGTIREFAANLGMHNFAVIGEVAGGDYAAARYLEVVGRNLSAALDIGDARPTLGGVAKGLVAPRVYFNEFIPWLDELGSHRDSGDRHVSVLDDHDHVSGTKLRFSTGATNEHQVVAGVALQLFTLGIPCLYYGTEQAFAGPEPTEWQWLPEWGGHDRYLREAMFGPTHPRPSGRDGLPPAAGPDPNLPGFGPFGTAGAHCFDEDHPAFVRIAALCNTRAANPVLRHGRQYLRPVAAPSQGFGDARPGELVAWSRILDDEEALCVLNPHGQRSSSPTRVLVGTELNPAGSHLTALVNTAEAAAGAAFAGAHPANSTVPVAWTADGTAYVELGELGPSEVVVFTNRPGVEKGTVSTPG